MQSYALGTRLVVAFAENTPLRGTKLIWYVTNKTHSSILIYYVFELNRFVRAVGYVFHLVLCPGNELYAHELVHSVLACPSQPFTIPKAASFLSEAVEYITK